jgi:hypothetical protein
MGHEHFEMKSDQPSFADLKKEYLHTQNNDQKIRLISLMEGAAMTREELQTLDRMLLDSPIKTRVRNRIKELDSSQAEAA